jgi:hypothetical protein
MDVTLPQEAHQLGEHQATYLPTVLPGRILIGVALAMLLISLLPFSIAIRKSSIEEYRVLSDSFRRDSIRVNTTLGVTMILLSVVLFALAYYHKHRRVDVYMNGFVFTGWRRSLTFPWDDVREVYISPVYRRSRGYSQIVNWTYSVHGQDGKNVKISGLEGMDDLGQIIQIEVGRRLLPQAMAAYQAGNDVRFGPKLSLSQKGVRVGKKLLLWPDVADVNLNRDYTVMIRQKGKRMLWKRMSSGKVANPMVLKALLDRIA